MKEGDQVEVRLWHTDVPAGTLDGMEGNYRTWVGPWLQGVVHGTDRWGNPWVLYRGEDGYMDARYFRVSDTRKVV